jgi:hypothetical protein
MYYKINSKLFNKYRGEMPKTLFFYKPIVLRQYSYMPRISVSVTL